MSTDESRDPVEALAEEFLARYRSGEEPLMTDYCDRHPHLADRIQRLFPTLLLMEQMNAPDHVSQATDQETPPRFSEYRILRTIGRGGMGVVYEAVHESLDRHVALKILPQLGPHDPVRVERFRREARAAAQLHHTNIVPVFDVGEQGGVHYYAMQFIAGTSLDQLLREVKAIESDAGRAADDTEPDSHGGQLTLSDEPGNTSSGGSQSPPAFELIHGDFVASARRRQAFFRNVARIGLQVAQALAYVHQHGVMHRDIKPSNLLLDADGRIWVTDFGLAKSDENDDLTHAGGVVGTMRYMAPERFRGESSDRSDVYALGATLYELLTRQALFVETDRMHLVQAIVTDEPVMPRRIDSTIPRDLETIVLKAVNKDPSRRYVSAAEFADDLRRWLSYEPIRAHPVTLPVRVVRWSQRRPLVASLLTSIVLLVIVGFALVTWKWREADSALQLAKKNFTAAEAARKRAAEQEQEALRQKGTALLNVDRAQKVVFEFFTDVANSPELLGGSQGAQLLRTTLLEKAERYYEAFLAEGHPLGSEQTLAMTRYQLARLQKLIGKLPAAEASYGKAIEDLEALREHREDDIELQHALAHCRDGLGAILQDTGRLRAADHEFRLALAHFNQLISAQPHNEKFVDDAAIVLGLHAESARRLGNRKAAAEFCRRAIAMRERLETDDVTHRKRHSLATSYMQMARAMYALDKRKEALRYAKQALEQRLVINRQLPKSSWNRNGLTDARLIMATIENETGAMTEAAQRLDAALKTQSDLCRDNPSVLKYQSLLGQVHVALGTNAMYTGQFELAQEQLRTAVDLLKNLHRLNPDSQIVEDRLAHASSRLGEVLSHSGESDAALDYHLESQRIFEQRCKDQPKLSHYRRDLAKTLVHMATIYHRRKKPEQAHSLYMRAMKLMEELTEAHPDVLSYRDGLIASYNNMGASAQAQREFVEAGGWFEKSRTTATALLAERPAEPKYQENVALSCNNLGGNYANRGQFTAAAGLFREAISIREELVRSRPKTLSYHTGLTSSRVNLAMVWRTLRDLDKAIDELDRADRELVAILEEWTTNPTARQQLSICRRILAEALHARCVRDMAKSNADGKRAVADARRACELNARKSWKYLVTLATAEANAENYEDAKKTLASAIPLAPASQRSALRKRTAIYQERAKAKADKPEKKKVP